MMIAKRSPQLETNLSSNFLGYYLIPISRESLLMLNYHWKTTGPLHLKKYNFLKRTFWRHLSLLEFSLLAKLASDVDILLSRCHFLCGNLWLAIEMSKEMMIETLNHHPFSLEVWVKRGHSVTNCPVILTCCIGNTRIFQSFTQWT